MTAPRARVVVREATADDHGSIAALLDRVFGEQPYAQRERAWRWRGQGVGPDAGDPPELSRMPGFLVAVRGDEVVGAQGIMPLRMKIGAEQVVAACTVDYAVDPTERGCGLELKLRATTPPVTGLAVSMSANAAAHRISRALGGAVVEAAAVTWTLPLRATPAVVRRVEARLPALVPAARLVGPLGDLLLAGRRAAARRRLPRGATLTPVQAFDRAFDRLWERVADRYPVQLVRDARYLDWRYRRAPSGRVRAIALRRGHEVLGLAVVAGPPLAAGLDTTAAIVELFDDGTEPRAAGLLLAAAVRHAGRTGLQRLIARTSSPDLARLLQRAGFVARREPRSPLTYRAADPAMASVLATDSYWHLSLGDGDAWI